VGAEVRAAVFLTEVERPMLEAAVIPTERFTPADRAGVCTAEVTLADLVGRACFTTTGDVVEETARVKPTPLTTTGAVAAVADLNAPTCRLSAGTVTSEAVRVWV